MLNFHTFFWYFANSYMFNIYVVLICRDINILLNRWPQCLHVTTVAQCSFSVWHENSLQRHNGLHVYGSLVMVLLFGFLLFLNVHLCTKALHDFYFILSVMTVWQMTCCIQHGICYLNCFINTTYDCCWEAEEETCWCRLVGSDN